MCCALGRASSAPRSPGTSSPHFSARRSPPRTDTSAGSTRFSPSRAASPACEIKEGLMDRRDFLHSLTVAGIAASVPGAFAQELLRTPAQGEGPFYPDKLPLDTDNDLLVINNGITPAVGAVTWLSGRILNARGEPVRNALVEIWQVDGN